jgi:hypothetical protein
LRAPDPTKEERLRWTYFGDVGCEACDLLGMRSVPEVHHLLDGGRRRGHLFTIPLCPAHHRGVGFEPRRHIACIGGEHARPRLFRHRFGTDHFLLRRTNERIAKVMELRVA